MINQFAILITLLISSLSFHAAAQDSTMRVKRIYPAKVTSVSTKPSRFTTTPEMRFSIYGEYKISGYTAMTSKAPDEAELGLLVGSFVRVDSSTVTGNQIDPMTFTIFQVERLQRDDYIFRVFGKDILAVQTDLPASFNVHKTDNERCYGIVEAGDGRVAIPYKGVLLYLVRTNS
jgi:hypothetical protein